MDVKAYIEKYRLDSLIKVTASAERGINDTVNPDYKDPFAPEWDDLVRLHDFVLTRKVTTVLEFGCGYSTIMFAHALSLNKAAHGAFVAKNLRRNNAFEAHAVDDSEEYIEISKQRIPQDLRSYVFFHMSRAHMCLFNDRIATEYRSLPNICPDLIYLDAPSQHSVLGDINGISTAHADRLPMACDILRFEHFLLPGTLIVVDGRTANARFLKTNFQRNWAHLHDVAADAHYFELQETPLGRYNKMQLDYCLGGKFLL